jgi:hypothetical protein
MKKIIIMMIVSFALASGVSAQKGRGFYRPHTRVIIAPAIGFAYGGFGYPYFNYGFGNPYFGYPYGYGFEPYRPASRLDAQIAAIKADYGYKIKAARRNKSISKAERKQNILALKSEREKAIAGAAQDYRDGKLNMKHNKDMNNTNPNNNQNLNKNQDQGTDYDLNS